MANIDTHRHLGGSIPPAYIWDIIHSRNYSYLAESLDDVIKAMTFSKGEPTHFHRFLDKFKILDEIEWDEGLIDGSISAVCGALNDENIDYCWMDFSINKYMDLPWHKSDAIKFIYDSFNQHRPNGVGLILSLKYESMRASQRQYAKLIDDPDIADILMGIDLVGDEEYFDPYFYQPIFKEWKTAGKLLRAHVGESQSARNIRDAVTILGVTNIAHGIKVFEDPYLVDMIIDEDICFDTAITSNYLTGVWVDNNHHPVVDMINNGISATVGSDDPIQCSTTLDREHTLARELGLGDDGCNIIRHIAYENTKRYANNFIHRV